VAQVIGAAHQGAGELGGGQRHGPHLLPDLPVGGGLDRVAVLAAEQPPARAGAEPFQVLAEQRHERGRDGDVAGGPAGPRCPGAGPGLAVPAFEAEVFVDPPMALMPSRAEWCAGTHAAAGQIPAASLSYPTPGPSAGPALRNTDLRSRHANMRLAVAHAATIPPRRTAPTCRGRRPQWVAGRPGKFTGPLLRRQGSLRDR